VKRFRKFENISHKENDFIEFEYVVFYKSFSKTVYKGSRIKSIEDARKENKKPLEEGCKKTNIFKNYF
tara:strand:+ start:489 stop:692 length:204 start_codon:yes stop_codon:yes gene_type:complete